MPLSQPAIGGTSVANSILSNVPKSRNIGVEVETIWQPVENLQFLVNYTYLDAKITKGLGIDPADTCAENVDAKRTLDAGVSDAFCAIPGEHQWFQDLKGSHLPNSASNRITVNGNYTLRLDAGDLTGSLTYVWRGAQYGSIFDRSYYRAPSWAQVDARVTFKTTDGKNTVIFFAKNLFNQLGFANGATATRQVGLPVPGNYRTTYELTPPRSFGVEIQHKFF